VVLPTVVPWFLQNFIGVDGWGMDGWYSLVINDHFRILFGFVNLPELVKYLRVERYLAAKIGTIYLVLVWWVCFIICD
jgi:hypothetical protein